jgi:beta-galactosidase
VSDDSLRSYIERGGRVLVLPRPEQKGLLGVTYQRGKTIGSLSVPAWPEAAGLSPSDLRLRNMTELNLIQAGGEIASDGLLARMPIGKGVAVFMQMDPAQLDADSKTYLRFSRWRQTRALSQILANMGGEFTGDQRLFKPVDSVEPSVALSGIWRAKYVNRIEDLSTELHPDPGMSPEAQALTAADVADSSWAEVKAPGSLEDGGAPWASANGEIVLRKTINVPPELAARELVLELGAVDDFDVTFVNGQRVGGSPDLKTSQWNVPRQYVLPAGLIKPGENVIAVRIWDQFSGGGFNGPATSMRLAPVPQKDNAPLYHRDYRTDFPLGDDPYRYYRW